MGEGNLNQDSVNRKNWTIIVYQKKKKKNWKITLNYKTGLVLVILHKYSMWKVSYYFTEARTQFGTKDFYTCI